MTYPHSPGWKEATTSLDAAEAIESHADTVRAHVLRILSERAFTADAVAAIIGESILTVRPRVTELFKAGRIIRTGQRLRNQSGRYAHVYRAPPREPVQLVMFS